MELTPSKINEFFQLLDFSFQDWVKKVPTFWDQVATEVASATEQNVYPFLSMFPTFREWLGPRTVNNVASRAFAVPNKHWEMTVGMDLNKFRDDTYGIYNMMMPQAAIQVAEWRDRELARVIETGTTATCWDGQPFFDTAHPIDPDNAASGTQSNKLIGATYDIAVPDPVAPFALARAAQALWKREDNQQMGTIGTLIMVHPNQEKYAAQICAAQLTAQAINANSGAGVSNVFQGKVDYIVNPFLTVTTGNPWYLLCVNRGLKPFIWQNRQSPQLIQRTAVTDDNVFRLRALEWGWDLRGAASFSFPFLAFRMSAS